MVPQQPPICAVEVPQQLGQVDLGQVLRRASTDFDGGYVMCGMVGHGDAFVMRDPNGIRPAFWYEDDEVVVAASVFDHTPHHYHRDYHTWTALLVAFSSDPVEEAVRVYYSSDLLHHTYHLHS